MIKIILVITVLTLIVWFSMEKFFKFMKMDFDQQEKSLQTVVKVTITLSVVLFISTAIVLLA